MAAIPITSVSLLAELSSGSANVRWTEFWRIYEHPMRDFLQARYPSADADDVLQETLVALMKALPDYHYAPDERGHFRNYLLGILGHKAMDHLRIRRRRNEVLSHLRDDRHAEDNVRDATIRDEEEWRTIVLEAAIEQLMSDNRLSATTREVFRHVALLHESPDYVAARFSITRNNVDQIKRRLLERLTKMIQRM